MEFSRFTGAPVIDCHVHPWPPWKSDTKLGEAALKEKSVELEKVIERGRLDGMHVYGNPDHSALYLKAANPGHFYAGGYAPWSFEANNWRSMDWDSYIESLIALGYDGVGEMGAKPVTRDRHTPLDSPAYEGFWAACEYRDFPVVCHVGDPEEFWSEQLTPDWAKARGWGYYRGDYPLLEELYAEVENILNRHPRVDVVFPHMLFLGPHMERLDELLKHYRGMHVDLAPGIEFLYSISRRRDDWQRFFTRHADRILLGTDIGMSKTIDEHLARIYMLRRFLETGDEFHTPDIADELLTRYNLPFIGLDLPSTALEKIYSGNMRRLWGNKQRDVDFGTAASSAEKEGHVGVAKALRKMR
jgi:predicted TIM-barrel fold metal-dependent hydrolase